MRSFSDHCSSDNQLIKVNYNPCLPSTPLTRQVSCSWTQDGPSGSLLICPSSEITAQPGPNPKWSSAMHLHFFHHLNGLGLYEVSSALLHQHILLIRASSGPVKFFHGVNSAPLLILIQSGLVPPQRLQDLQILKPRTK